MKDLVGLLFRALMVAICCFATWMSTRHARADLAAAPRTAAGFERALRIEPENVELVVADALLISSRYDPSPAVDEQLLRASRMNPMNSELLIALGLRAEFRGDNAQAEQYLAKATEVDHTLVPAWTFANFCVRTGQPDKFWPMAQRCLSLDSGFNPRLVFDLASHVTDDSRKVRGIVPKGPRLIDYLGYLMDTHHTDEAIALWPDALDALDPPDPGRLDIVLRYCGFLAEGPHMPLAVQAWNQLVERHIVHSGRLDPETGVSIADPDFSFLPADGLFGWQTGRENGLFVTTGRTDVRFELDGNEPMNSFILLSTTAALLPGKTYRLDWQYDASQLISPQDPGFEIRILQQPGNRTTACPPFLNAGEKGTCEFATGSDIYRAAIELRYARASGTTRASGTLRVSNIHLEFAP